ASAAGPPQRSGPSSTTSSTGSPTGRRAFARCGLRPTGRRLRRSTRRSPVAPRPTPIGEPIKVGVIADQTGPLSFVGLANANVARMVVAALNREGGLLGRPLELYLEDSATDDDVAAARAAKLVENDKVDVVFGGIYSSTRQAIKGTAVVEGKTLY